MEQCESAAALLESVREQEVQFEQLTRALEEERRRVGLPATSPSALGHPLPHMQVTLPNKPSDARSDSLKSSAFFHLPSDLWISISFDKPACMHPSIHPLFMLYLTSPFLHQCSAILCTWIFVCIIIRCPLSVFSPQLQINLCLCLHTGVALRKYFL